MSKLEAISLPKLNMLGRNIEQSAKADDEIDILVCNYNFRKDAFKFRLRWGIPEEEGLDADTFIEEGDVDCSCSDIDELIDNRIWTRGFVYRSYWDWHYRYADEIHDLTFHEECMELKDNYFPQEPGWISVLYDIVLFGRVFSIPSISEYSDGAYVIDIEGIKSSLRSGRHPYDIHIKEDASVPKVEVSIYRDMSTKDWSALVSRMKTLTKELPSDFPISGRVGIRKLATIADLRRRGHSNGDVARMIGDGLSQSSISQYYKRAKEEGL